MLLRHEPTGIDVDISLGCFAFESDLIRRATVHVLGNLRVPAATPEDLVVMKGLAQRPGDLADIDLLAKVCPDLNKDQALADLTQFAIALDMPELITTVQTILEKNGL